MSVAKTNYYPNPNNYFEKIDEPIKAYILGIIYGAGTIKENCFFIKENNNNRDIFFTIQNNINALSDIEELERTYFDPYKSNEKRESPNRKLNVYSKDICKDLNRLLYNNENRYEKIFPTFDNEEYYIYFIRGYYESRGFCNFNKLNSPFCAFSGSKIFLEKISDKLELNSEQYIRDNIKNKIKNNKELEYVLFFTDTNCLEFLNTIYKSVDVKNKNTVFYLKSKYNFYSKCCSWFPKCNMKKFYYVLEHPKAVAPVKANPSDSGYDICIIEKLQMPPDCAIDFYDTGLSVKPPYGYYLELVPRSSIYKSGYLLANSIGVIDRSYTSTLKLPLYKYDKTKPDLDLTKPVRIAQLIPRPIEHFIPVQVDQLDSTNRGNGGFGSTG